jgi:membrane protease YdiL (CAAX protease family)
MRGPKSTKEMARLVPMGIVLGVFVVLGEEIGCRGLDLIRLQEKHTV